MILVISHLFWISLSYFKYFCKEFEQIHSNFWVLLSGFTFHYMSFCYFKWPLKCQFAIMFGVLYFELFECSNKNQSQELPVKIAIVGGDSYISSVLRPYVELFSNKASDFVNFVRFYVIPLGESEFMSCLFKSSLNHFLLLSTSWVFLFP